MTKSKGDSRPLRILLINEFFYPDSEGGSGTSIARLVASFKKQEGVEIIAVTSRYAYRNPATRYKSTESWDGVKIHRVWSPNWAREKKIVKRFAGNLVFALMAAAKSLTLPRPDVVWVNTAPVTIPIAGRIIQTLRGVPYAYLIYDLDPDRTVALGVKPADARSVRILENWQRKWLQGAGRVIAIGRCMRDHLVKKYGVDPDKCAVVEIGADPNLIKPMPKDTEFRRKNGIEGFVMLYSGNFGMYHDFETPLQAAKRLQTTRPDITFVFVGGGQKKAFVENFISENNLKNVRLFPFVPEEEFGDLMASADMHIVTLEPGMEGLCVPGKFYNCLASGRPVLALMSAGTEIATVVEEAAVGYRVSSGDVDTLVNLMSSVTAEELDAQGARALDIFTRLYTADRIGEKMLDAIAQSARPNKRASRATEGAA